MTRDGTLGTPPGVTALGVLLGMGMHQQQQVPGSLVQLMGHINPLELRQQLVPQQRLVQRQAKQPSTHGSRQLVAERMSGISHGVAITTPTGTDPGLGIHLGHGRTDPGGVEVLGMTLHLPSRTTLTRLVGLVGVIDVIGLQPWNGGTRVRTSPYTAVLRRYFAASGGRCRLTLSTSASPSWSQLAILMPSCRWLRI